MNIEGELRALLDSPAEAGDVDFKETVHWGDRRAQLELARDIVCLANRAGGALVFGVRDNGNSRWQRVGLATDDHMPDTTQIGQVLANHFEPPPAIVVYTVNLDGKDFGLIKVEEFARTPHVCHRIGQDSKGVILRPGALYRRTDATQCAEITTGVAMADLVWRAVTKTGVAVQTISSGEALPGSSANAPAASPERRLSGSTEPLRVCLLRPGAGSHHRPLQELLPSIDRASVANRYAAVLFPRGVEIPALRPSDVIREPHRILIERARGSGDDKPKISVLEATDNLIVELRESLWERDRRFDFDSLIAFVLTALVFARDYYASTSVSELIIEIGIANPTGLVLATDPAQYFPMMQTYVVTSGGDIVVGRTTTLAALGDTARRTELGRDIVSDITWMFGYQFADDVWDVHLGNITKLVPAITG